MQQAGSTSHATPSSAGVPDDRTDENGGTWMAFKMQLLRGKEAEYKKRHDEIWPGLQVLLKDTGISEYSIFLDEATNALFGVLNIKKGESLDALPQQEIMQQWWAYMADIMETNEDHSPVSVPLKKMFYLP